MIGEANAEVRKDLISFTSCMAQFLARFAGRKESPLGICRRGKSPFRDLQQEGGGPGTYPGWPLDRKKGNENTGLGERGIFILWGVGRKAGCVFDVLYTFLGAELVPKGGVRLGGEG